MGDFFGEVADKVVSVATVEKVRCPLLLLQLLLSYRCYPCPAACAAADPLLPPSSSLRSPSARGPRALGSGRARHALHHLPPRVHAHPPVRPMLLVQLLILMVVLLLLLLLLIPPLLRPSGSTTAAPAAPCSATRVLLWR